MKSHQQCPVYKTSYSLKFKWSWPFVVRDLKLWRCTQRAGHTRINLAHHAMSCSCTHECKEAGQIVKCWTIPTYEPVQEAVLP